MIYLDYNATTPCDPAVFEEMKPYFLEKFGNASSTVHSFGWMAEQAVKTARQQVAALIGAEDVEIIFTSGATESCNLAIQGVFEMYASKGNHIITCKTEHKAVLDVLEYLESKGADVTYLKVNQNGLIDLDELKAAIRPETILIAMMYANNETGVVQPIKEIGAIAKENKVLFFSDATQAVGKTPLNVMDDGIDILALSAHKFYGPKGVGAIYLRRKKPRVAIQPLLRGGGQEKNIRSGTLNVPGIVGLGKACAILLEKGIEEQKRYSSFQKDLEEFMQRELKAVVNGVGASRIPNVSNLAFEGYDANKILGFLKRDIAFSLSSACATNSLEPSHVLRAMQLNGTIVKGSLRLSWGRFTNGDEIEIVKNKFKKALSSLSNR